MMTEALVKAPANLAEMIEIAQNRLALSDTHIAEALGFDHPVVTELLKQGKMRLPISKVLQLAKLLQIEPARLFRLVLGEHSPEMLEAIQACYAPLLLSTSEVWFIQAVREAAGVRRTATMTLDKDAVLALVTAAPAC